MDTNTTPPRLGRCKEKGCKHALFVSDEALIVNVDGFNEVKGDGRAYRVGNNGVFARCPDRHKFFPLKQIKGTYSKDHKCDARCMNAKGHECTCSCGGANHGRGYATEVVEASATPVTIVRDENEPITEKQEPFLRALLAERRIPDDFGKTGDERVADALERLDAGLFTKRQATATIKWLLDLPRKD